MILLLLLYPLPFIKLRPIGAHYPQKEPIKRGIDLLKQRQLLNGDWVEFLLYEIYIKVTHHKFIGCLCGATLCRRKPQESICGVFNKNCMINYSNFKNIFPIWALARFTERYPQESPL
ncbi:hypothetical protein Zmor_019077 [Zophobas morio]|uniref:Uncharacterized protein n=1 Tax=Zophobas morio TaxID=2755281 RepID=A0AA38HM42_9CUCU|nr:hypothetical protein Zmor_019077 [Zophobas morio]